MAPRSLCLSSKMFVSVSPWLAFAALCSPISAWAQDEAEGEVDMGEEEETLDETEVEPMSDETVGADGAEDDDESYKRKSDGSTQLLLGVRYRALITPKFLINMFGVDGGRTVLLHGVGPEIGGYWGQGKNGFMVMFSPWYAGYGLKATPFKGKNDDDSAWEIVESRMHMWYLTVDALWDRKVTDRVSINFGGSFGLGIVGGQLFRNEAFIDNANPEFAANGEWPNLSTCTGPGSPSAAQCPTDGDYGQANRWPVYPWVNGQIGVRYQPVDEFVGRIDFGLGSSGFWIGLGADYSIFL